MSRGRALVVAGLAAGLAYAARRTLPEHERVRWGRTSFTGAPITLLEGPALAVGVLAGLAASGEPGAGGAAVAVAGSALSGALDDLAGDASAKGLKGHLGALRRGEVTTGALKILGIGASALAGTWQADRGSERGALDTVVGAGVVAGAANVANLLDLRPGRALKAAALVGLPLMASRRPGASVAAAAIGSGMGVVRPDLRGESMLGDTGANAVGAAIGSALAQRLGVRGRLVALAAVTGLTLASERVSFTAVIERTPGLREIDRWGRTPR